ncbi:unnamed protein product [Schistosoma turkestanicum]|nr:unnamed protein product [Schistosoma turkestanicum]
MKGPEIQTEVDFLVKLKGGPGGNQSWDPEPALLIIPIVKSDSVELSTILFDACFYIILAILILGKIFVIYRYLYKLCNCILRRLFLSDPTSSVEPEDWNKTSINDYTSNTVEYILQSPEEQKLFTDDYKELMKVLNFVDEHSRES